MKKSFSIALVVLVGAMSATQAQVVKCKGHNGQTIYSDTLCLGNKTGQEVNTKGSVIDSSYFRGEAEKARMDRDISNPPLECQFKSYKHGDAKGKVLADNATRECIGNLTTKKNGQPISTVEYQMWKDHNDDTTAKRYAPKVIMR